MQSSYSSVNNVVMWNLSRNVTFIVGGTTVLLNIVKVLQIPVCVCVCVCVYNNSSLFHGSIGSYSDSNINRVVDEFILCIMCV